MVVCSNGARDQRRRSPVMTLNLGACFRAVAHVQPVMSMDLGPVSARPAQVQPIMTMDLAACSRATAQVQPVMTVASRTPSAQWPVFGLAWLQQKLRGSDARAAR